MPRKKKFTVEEAAKLVINSKKMAELFITGYMERHKATREAALKKLKELGIEISQLSDS